MRQSLGGRPCRLEHGKRVWGAKNEGLPVRKRQAAATAGFLVWLRATFRRDTISPIQTLLFDGPASAFLQRHSTAWSLVSSQGRCPQDTFFRLRTSLEAR